MSAARSHRGVVLATAAVAYAAVFIVFALVEEPGLGLGHFFYVPVALVALATDGVVGFGAGVLAAALYAAAVLLAPRLPVRDVVTVATAIRFVTFSGVGALVGTFAARNRTLVAQLRELADRDSLTGLANVRVFDEHLARRCAEGNPFALVLADMDNLKQINDVHGHEAGNRALRRAGEILAALAPANAHVARIGGDEFAFLVTGDAGRVCDELRRALAREELQMSFGVTLFPTDAHGALELFRKADDRLYAAKLLRSAPASGRTPIVSLADARP